ncbi:GNAT family N-acetyltransferase [Pseudoduganella albidiflava]|uniref:L-ornithine N(alpha)-acyltransferase n=1 Tax=Pseudoduganella albidiflava TaxID=321983 RepID=A0A411X0R4_9BURK|nr:GNAT family N-acyltransferase [Pseudoduganella albidiflava]QBI02528.1 GNAT family N-acetyltransferase [Pseudoduganella albidiflava]GGY42070.1 hypothetical protein GCM10007387_25040 [Pseudoduganella albidiflava]
MQQTTIATGTRAPRPRLITSIAASPEELREAQRLRYRVFIEGMDLAALARPDGLDCDEFDEHCDHLLVRDAITQEVVGTYRVLAPAGARRLGRLYSEGEFDMGRLNPLRSRIIEAGRACIHPSYRGGSVIMLLWAALAEYMHRHGCDYLAGCASISLADGGHNAVAVFRELRETRMGPAEYRVTPHLPFPHSRIEPAASAILPPLLKGYMRSGAWVCGDPAWDPDFDSADLFLLMPLANLDSRYAKHYGVDGTVEMAIAA